MVATATTVAPPPDLKQNTDFWDLSKRSLHAQRAGRYVPDSKDDPDSIKAARTWPDVAGAIIDTYSKPGDMVFDPMAGTGVTLVEAVWRGRAATGIELETPRYDQACKNLRFAVNQGALDNWLMTLGDARGGLIQEFFGDQTPRLIIIDPPFGATRQDGGNNRFGAALHNYTGEDRIKSRGQRDPNNLGNLKFGDYLREMQIVYAQALYVAANGAYMAVVLKDYRKDHTRVDLLGHTRHICEAAGWRYYDRATIYLGRASDVQRRNAKANQHLLPITQDLLVFKKG